MKTQRALPLPLQLAALRRYRGHWRRRDHTHQELRRLAFDEPDPVTAQRFTILAAVLEARVLGVPVNPLNHGLGVSNRMVWRVAEGYKKEGFRALLRGPLKRAREAFGKLGARLRRRRAAEVREAARREASAALTERVVEAYARLRSVVRVGAEVGLSPGCVSKRLIGARQGVV